MRALHARFDNAARRAGSWSPFPLHGLVVRGGERLRGSDTGPLCRRSDRGSERTLVHLTPVDCRRARGECSGGDVGYRFRGIPPSGTPPSGERTLARYFSPLGLRGWVRVADRRRRGDVHHDRRCLSDARVERSHRAAMARCRLRGLLRPGARPIGLSRSTHHEHRSVDGVPSAFLCVGTYGTSHDGRGGGDGSGTFRRIALTVGPPGGGRRHALLGCGVGHPSQFTFGPRGQNLRHHFAHRVSAMQRWAVFASARPPCASMLPVRGPARSKRWQRRH